MTLSVEVRSKMREEKICTVTIKNGAKLNLLQLGSDYLAFPVFMIRLNRKELYKGTNKDLAIRVFANHAYEQIGLLNELF